MIPSININEKGVLQKLALVDQSPKVRKMNKKATTKNDKTNL
jgi:hypothetical protein